MFHGVEPNVLFHQQGATSNAPSHADFSHGHGLGIYNGEMSVTIPPGLSCNDARAPPCLTASLISTAAQPPSSASTLAVARTTSARRQHRKSVESFRCDYPGCEHQGTFSRSWELDRHKRSRHRCGIINPFVCGAHGCYKRELPCSFLRPDKLTSHIKAAHNLNTCFETCPVEGCVFGPATLEDLGVHISRAHQLEAHGRAVLNATTCKVLRCPLWQCRKVVTSEKLIGHIECHSATDIEIETGRLQAESLIVDFTPPLERQMQTPFGFTVQVVCPVCTVVLDDIQPFAVHLSANHIYEPQSGGYEHFVKWKATWALSVDNQTRARVDKLVPWRPVYSSIWYLVRRGTELERTLSCPMCPFAATRHRSGRFSKDQEDKIAEHHLSFLQRNADATARLYPHRMQILKLCPAFITHPVFSDFDPPK